MSADTTANIAVRVTSDTSGANSDLTSFGANWDRTGEMGVRAARSLANGIGGLLSAEQNIYTAQQRVNVATISYDLAVRQSGAGSLQAQKALISLQQAQEGVTIAQDQLNLRFIQFALTTGPQIYTSLIRMAAAFTGVTVADFELNQSLTQTIILLGITLGLLTAGLAVFGGILGGAAASAAATPTTGPTSFGTAGGTPGVTVNQTNTFNSTTQTSQKDMVDFANQSAAKAIQRRVRS